jgi:predicted DNA-binding protein
MEVITMQTIQYSTKLTQDQVKALKKISEQTHIPQAVLVRQAINALIEELKDKVVPVDFLKLVKKRVKEDKTLLKRLASS